MSVPGLGVLDGTGGALLSGAVALGLIWLAGAVALQTPGVRSLRADIQRSSILRALNDVLPPSGPVLNALARFDPLQSIDGPQANVPAPRAAIARDPDVRVAADGVVKVLGTACGLGIEGSGWIAGYSDGGTAGIVVTAARQVATACRTRWSGGRSSGRRDRFDGSVRALTTLLRLRGPLP